MTEICLADLPYLERVEVMTRILEVEEPIEINNVAKLDQLRAATEENTRLAALGAAEAMDLMEDVRYTEQEGERSPIERAIVLAALERYGITYCVHAGSIQPMLINLCGQVVTCQACHYGRAWPRRVPETYCDWCLLPVPDWTFGAISLTVGPLTVVGDACSPCYDFITDKFGL